MIPRIAGASSSVTARPVVSPPISFIERQLIFDGQSFNYYPLADSSSGAYPNQLIGLLPSEWWPNIDIVGVNSTTYADRAADATTRVDAIIDPTRPTVLIDVAGTGDLYQAQGNMTAAATLAAAESYATNRKTAGVDIYIIATTTPTSLFSGGAEAQRVAYNALLHQSAVFDAVLDIAALPHAADPANSTYYGDTLHPTATLAAEFAAAAERVLKHLRLPT